VRCSRAVGALRSSDAPHTPVGQRGRSRGRPPSLVGALNAHPRSRAWSRALRSSSSPRCATRGRGGGRTARRRRAALLRCPPRPRRPARPLSRPASFPGRGV